MNIFRDNQAATLTLVPTEANEARDLVAILALLKPEDRLHYGGKKRDDDGKLCAVLLHCGGHKEERTETTGKVTVNCSAHVGGIELILRGTTMDDMREVAHIASICFFGSGGLIFIGETEVAGKKSIMITASRCKHCNAGILHLTECEWNTCDACAEKCEHAYIRGAIHGGNIDIGVGEFCNMCGRGKPLTESEPAITLLERHSAVEEELGIDIVYI